MTKVKVHLYGVFETYGVGKFIEVEASENISLKDFKEKFVQKLESASKKKCDMKLLNECAFSNDDEIIDDDYVITAKDGISILPPICGG